MEKTAGARIWNADQRDDVFACRNCANWDSESPSPKKRCREHDVDTWPGNTCDSFTN